MNRRYEYEYTDEKAERKARKAIKASREYIEVLVDD